MLSEYYQAIDIYYFYFWGRREHFCFVPSYFSIPLEINDKTIKYSVQNSFKEKLHYLG